ncbi:MAG: protein phosphatase 2C domain-containing protein [Clostridiales bacterium]|nr:protein phosphatase 2C domain-containing protein [Clostridiales bacterium]
MKNAILGYGSVRGSSHKQKGIKNQDYCIVKEFKFGTVLAVADGHGSHKNAHIGSRAACRAVIKAVKLWNSYKEKDFRLLIPLIHSIWNIEIYPFRRNECGTTCLFAFHSNTGRLWAGQLGDGNIFIRIDDKTELIAGKEEEFSNITVGMSSVSSFSDWKLKEYITGEKSVAVCLMTDGVSETLIDETKEDFVKYIWEELRSKADLSETKRFLRNILSSWNTVNAGDDRTLASYERI